MGPNNSLDTTHLPVLMQTLSTLLKDRSPLAIGSVVIAFNAICPDRLELLHPHYRRLCRMVVDADEWGQVQLLELLTRYARKMLSRPPSESAPVRTTFECISRAPLLIQDQIIRGNRPMRMRKRPVMKVMS